MIAPHLPHRWAMSLGNEEGSLTGSYTLTRPSLIDFQNSNCVPSWHIRFRKGLVLRLLQVPYLRPRLRNRANLRRRFPPLPLTMALLIRPWNVDVVVQRVRRKWPPHRPPQSRPAKGGREGVEVVQRQRQWNPAGRMIHRKKRTQFQRTRIPMAMILSPTREEDEHSSGRFERLNTRNCSTTLFLWFV